MIKNRLTAILAKKSMTLNKLASETDIRYATLWNFANNKTKKADYEDLNKICKALKCTPGDILKYEKDLENK